MYINIKAAALSDSFCKLFRDLWLLFLKHVSRVTFELVSGALHDKLSSGEYHQMLMVGDARAVMPGSITSDGGEMFPAFPQFYFSDKRPMTGGFDRRLCLNLEWGNEGPYLLQLEGLSWKTLCFELINWTRCIDWWHNGRSVIMRTSITLYCIQQCDD